MSFGEEAEEEEEMVTQVSQVMSYEICIYLQLNRPHLFTHVYSILKG